MGGTDGMEPEDEKTKKLNEDFVEFMRKRSGSEVPRYTAKLKTYVDIQRKRARASAARRNYEGGHHHEKTASAAKKKTDDEQKDKTIENSEHPSGDKDRMNRSSINSDGVDTSEGSYRPLGRGNSGSTNIDPDFTSEPFIDGNRIRDDKLMPRSRSMSRSRSGEPSDRCGRRRRRRRSRRRRRRRRSCRRRRRRRRSCRRRRRSCRRRRSRRRRRRSCGRRRRRARRGCRS